MKSRVFVQAYAPPPVREQEKLVLECFCLVEWECKKNHDFQHGSEAPWIRPFGSDDEVTRTRENSDRNGCPGFGLCAGISGARPDEREEIMKVSTRKNL